MQYDNQLTNLKNILPGAKNVLIALPAGSNIDRLAAGLALYLSLSSQGKEVSIVFEDNILVGQSHLFGIDKIEKNVSGASSGDFVLTMEGIATQGPTGGSVPSLDKLDYYVEGNNLNLVFKVLPGQTFQPTKMTPHYQGSGYEAIFVVGAALLNNLGSIYSANTQLFNGPQIINIDNQPTNTGFGQTNVVDFSASAISEITASVMQSLGLAVEGDIATNLITGIFDATGNLTNPSVNAGTYEIIANLMKVGGQKPQFGGFNINPMGFQPQTAPQPMPQIPVMEQPMTQNTIMPDFPSVTSPGPQFDLSALMPAENTVNFANTAQTPSPEERPSGERIISDTEPDWLTPKIFKGTSIG